MVDDDEIEQETKVIRSIRDIQTLERYFLDEYFNITNEMEPQGFIEVSQVEYKDKLIPTVEEEMKFLKEIQAYDSVTLPKGRKELKKYVGVETQI